MYLKEKCRFIKIFLNTRSYKQILKQKINALIFFVIFFFIKSNFFIQAKKFEKVKKKFFFEFLLSNSLNKICSLFFNIKIFIDFKILKWKNTIT